MTYEVVIIQRILPHYRIELFRRLKNTLFEKGVDLTLYYGQEQEYTVPKTEDIPDKWAIKLKNKYYSLFRHVFVFQPVPLKVINADLVIVEQANSLLINYILIILSKILKIKIAYWGHGKNMQSLSRTSLSERLKYNLTKNVNWWFAYTNLSASFVMNAGFDRKRISVLDNTIDTSSFLDALDSVSNNDQEKIKADLGITSNNILLYCGGMYKNKKLGFIIESCFALKKQIADIHVIFIGSGPDEYKIEHIAKDVDWVHLVGAKYGNERASYFKMSKVFIMPGVVGLAVVDSFISETPLFTTDVPLHGPEIAYLENNINGVMSEPNIEDYTNKLFIYLSSEELLKKLQLGCRKSAGKYTLKNMVCNFENGILSCLEKDI